MFKNNEDVRKMCIVTCDSHEDEYYDIMEPIFPNGDDIVCCISTKNNCNFGKSKKKALKDPHVHNLENSLFLS